MSIIAEQAVVSMDKKDNNGNVKDMTRRNDKSNDKDGNKNSTRRSPQFALRAVHTPTTTELRAPGEQLQLQHDNRSAIPFLPSTPQQCQNDAFTTPPPAPSHRQSPSGIATTPITNEEFDEEGNVVGVANLVFIQGVLGQGAFGTVRLARRKLNTSHHSSFDSTILSPQQQQQQHESFGGGGGSGNASTTSSNTHVSIATTPNAKTINFAPGSTENLNQNKTLRPKRPRRRQLSKSSSEPKKKSSFFSEKSPEEISEEEQTQKGKANDAKPGSFTTQSEEQSSTEGKRRNSRSLSPDPFSPRKEKEQSQQTDEHQQQHRQGQRRSFNKYRTASTPLHYRQYRGPRFHHSLQHGKSSPLGLFTRTRSSLNHYDDEYENEQLVAVKILSKSILKRKRTMERDKSTKRVKVKTAWQQVEREIALMKKLSHPNLVQMYEVIDSPESDMAYMVLEYMPGGEILTYQNDGTFRRKNPRPAATDARYKQIDGIVDGHFDEEHAALYFVDILHGLAYLHQHHICHRDLKPENILLDANCVAKVGDFGVSHIFEKESKVGARRMASIDEHQRYQGEYSGKGSKLSDSWSESSSSSLEETPERNPPRLTRKDTDAALSMRGMAGSGMLSKTEGTWCFWSPEMCEGSEAFSGYAADMWAAGVCLYIFVTGKLPFYSEVPQELFDMIAYAEIQYSGLGLSNSLVDLLKQCLEKDPNLRAGVGDCLQHPFLQVARQKRIRQLSAEFEISRKRSIIISEEDIRTAFRTVTSVPVQVLRSAGKKIQESLANTRERLANSSSSVTEGDSLVKHFQEGIHHLRNRMPSMGSSAYSAEGDSTSAGSNQHKQQNSSEQQNNTYSSQQKQIGGHHRVVFFGRRTSSDLDNSLHSFDGSPPVSPGKGNDSELASRVSRLSSGVSFGSNVTDEVPPVLLEGENEEDMEQADHKQCVDERGEGPNVPPELKKDEKMNADSSNKNSEDTQTKDMHTLGHRHENALGLLEKAPSYSIATWTEDNVSKNKKQKKQEKFAKCVIQ